MKLVIETKNAKPSELAAKRQLERQLKSHNIEPFIFSDKVIIEEQAISHSHPIITIGSFPYSDENIRFTELIHEQLHWYFDQNKDKVSKAISQLKKFYPEVPVDYPMGCCDEHATYEHLLITRLCHLITTNLIGKRSADQVLHFLQNHHYIWVFNTIESDGKIIDRITQQSGLSL